MSIEFGELPENPRARGTGSAEWQRVAAALRARPGEWAKVQTKHSPRNAYAAVGNINRRMVAALRDPGFKAAARGCDIWVCYSPE